MDSVHVMQMIPSFYDVTIKFQETRLEKRLTELEMQYEEERKCQDDRIKEEQIKEYEDDYQPAYPDYGLVKKEDYLKLALLAISHLETKYDRENKPSCLFDSFGKKYDKNHLVNLHEAGLFITSKVEDDVVYILNTADPKHPDRYVSDVNSLTNESCQYWLNSVILSASLKAQKEAVERMVKQMNPFARLLFKLFYREPKDHSTA
jgi:hypothetical protein